MSARPVAVPDDQVLPELSQPPDPAAPEDDEWLHRGQVHAGAFTHDKRHKLYSVQFNRAEVSTLLWYLEQAVSGKQEGFEWTRQGVLLYETIKRRAMQAGFHL